MPVRSLSSSVFKWPDSRQVKQALCRWIVEIGSKRPEVLRIGYIGSYARGDWGVGSDLDLFILVEDCDLPFSQRASTWDTRSLPVPTDVWVYTRSEWAKMAGRNSRFYRDVMREAVWLTCHQR